MIFANVLGKSLYQWELGRLFAAPAPKNGTVSRIEFCHKGTKPEPLVPKEDNGLVIAPIPNYLLQESDPIYVYLVYVDENRLETITHYVLSVTPRPKPADYVYTETEVLTWAALDKRIEALEVAEVPPSDWNATEGEAGHVLNRTHYAERYTAEVIAGVKHTLSGSSTLGAKAKIPIEGGKTYVVNWNGTEYTRVANAVHEVDFSYVQIGGRGDAPFNITATLDGLIMTIQPLDGSTEISVDIYEVGEIVHKLPSKYLPDDIITDEAVASAFNKYMAEHPIEETDPTVPAWAKAESKPTYTAQEVGALPADTKIPTALIVTVTDNKASHNATEIYNYVQSGGTVYLNGGEDFGNILFTLAVCSAEVCSFALPGEQMVAFGVMQDGSASMEMVELARAEAVPTDQHINELIDGKLANIPTGGGVEPLFVTSIDDNVASHTPMQMLAHVAAGGAVYYMINNNEGIELSAIVGNEACFTTMLERSAVSVIVKADGTVQMDLAEFALKDNIPTDDHINSLIDTKIAEIPSGGGGGSEWRLIRTVVIPEDISTDTSGVAFAEQANGGVTFAFDTDESGKPFEFRELFIYAHAAQTGTNGSFAICISRDVPGYFAQGGLSVKLEVGKSGSLSHAISWSTLLDFVNEKVHSVSYGATFGGGAMNNVQTSAKAELNGYNIAQGDYGDLDKIRRLCCFMKNASGYGFSAGSTFTFYGR